MNNTPTNSKQDCFAYDIRKGQCTALTAANCADCPFYKSAEQENNELKKVARRLALMGPQGAFHACAANICDRRISNFHLDMTGTVVCASVPSFFSLKSGPEPEKERFLHEFQL